jgi:signal transduction histidine kinase
MKERCLRLSLGKSVLLRRMILLLLITVLLSGLLSAGIYIFVAQHLYVDMRAKELLPIARTVADMITDTRQNEAFFDRGNNSFGATLHIYDANGVSVMTDRRNPGNGGNHGKRPETSGFDLSESDTLTMIFADLKTAMSGDEVSAIRKSPDGDSFLVVGVPIESGGTVIFTKPMSELNDTMSGLNLTLIVSTLAAFLIMLIPAYFLTRRLVVPIRQMRDVAHAMAQGDFSHRADESVKGEIGELGHSMNYFAEESERLEQTRRDYVANVSHELRTPIASIRAMGETLRDGMAKTEEKRELFYNNIVRESMRLSRLVEDLLELSRLQAGIEAMQKKRFDLREVLQNIVDGYGDLAADANLQFSVNADMSVPILVISNADRIEQVLVALMDNAIKHAPENGPITLSCEIADGKVVVWVSNTGEEIPAADLPFIFERFYKVDKSHSEGGNGLGLSIAKEIIRGLGEKIWVERDNGETRFAFTVEIK